MVAGPSGLRFGRAMCHPVKCRGRPRRRYTSVYTCLYNRPPNRPLGGSPDLRGVYRRRKKNSEWKRKEGRLESPPRPELRPKCSYPKLTPSTGTRNREGCAPHLHTDVTTCRILVRHDSLCGSRAAALRCHVPLAVLRLLFRRVLDLTVSGVVDDLRGLQSERKRFDVALVAPVECDDGLLRHWGREADETTMVLREAARL